MNVLTTLRLFAAVALSLLVSIDTAKQQKKVLFTSIPYFSHVAFQMDLAVELNRRGYSVAVALPSNFRAFVDRRCRGHVRFVTLGSYSRREEYVQMGTKQDIAESSLSNGLELDRMNKALVGPLTDVMKKERPDVVVADNLFILAIRIADQLDIPVVGTYILGAPGDLTIFSNDLDVTLSGRMRRLWYAVRTAVTLSIGLKWDGIEMDDIIPDMFAPPLFGIHISFVGYSFPFYFQHPPTHAFIGLTSQELNETEYGPEDIELKRYLDMLPAETQVVYVAFGTLMKMEQTLVDVVVEGVLESGENVNVVLAWQDFLTLPPHWPSDRVRVEKWTHQPMVLKHDRTKLFVTHGGIMSIGEAIISHTPVLVLPQFADQPANALVAVRAGFALSIRTPQEITTEAVDERVSTILADHSKFVAAVEVVDKLRELAGGVRRGGDLIESLLVAGPDRFQPVDWDLSFWAAKNLDIVGLLMLLVLVVLVLGCWLMSMCCRFAAPFLKPSKLKPH